MEISLSLLRSFIPCDLPLQKIGDTLTLLGIEVDKIIHEQPPFSGVAVGEILSVSPHPNATKLQVAIVSDGSTQTQVVCGAPNCREGLKTAFAKPGAILKGLCGKEMKIELSSIRGVESHGMLCSEAELGVSDRHQEGICELPRETATGADLLPLLWDPVFELSLTPNLGHCMSALGVARELSAALQIPLIKKKQAALREHGHSIDKKVRVSIEDEDLCPRYMCRMIEGVKIGPSPLWLQRQLIACGMKSISNVVDITNYILIKWGQPLHAFDYDRLEGASLSVAPLLTAQKFLGLDGIERDIPEGALAISDQEGIAAIAGILGGERTSVREQTQNILLEAAYFQPAAIRKTAKRLGLKTESSHRFEKGTDPLNMEEALHEAVLLILEICGGKLAQGAIDLKTVLEPKHINCRLEKVNKILGTPFSMNEVEHIFGRLGFGTKSIGMDTLQVQVPLFRSDVNEEIDLVEEVARIYGYNHLEKKSPSYAASRLPHDPHFLFEKEIRRRSIALGLQEFLTSDLISPRLVSLAQESIQPDISYLKALHAKTEEYSILRPSLLPNLLQVVKKNIDYKNQTIHAFEIGRIHFLQKGKSIEVPMGAWLLTGKASLPYWGNKPADVDFYHLKGLLENLFEGLKIQNLLFSPSEHVSFHPFAQANIYIKDVLIGSLGEVHPNLLAKLDIKQKVFFAEIQLPPLMEAVRKQVRMHPICPFPSSERDWTVALPLKMQSQDIFSAIDSFSSPLLVKREVLDIYYPEGQMKNTTFRFTYRDSLKTISFEEVEKEHARLTAYLENSFSTC